MLTGHNVVYLGPERWEGLWRNRHWLMSLFARHNTVMYVEPVRGLRPMLLDWAGGHAHPAPGLWRPITQLPSGVFLYRQPPFAPATGVPVLKQVSAGVRRYALASAAKRIGIERPILWISRPWLADLARSFDARLTIYHVVDEYSAYPGQSAAVRARTQQAEAVVLRDADMVIVSSKALLEAKRQVNPRTFLVPNGVNQAGYQQHLKQGAPAPAELARIPRPRLGYLGQIGAKLDFDLLQAVALARPNWSLVFLGSLTGSQAQDRWDALRALPNVFHLGAVAGEQVPAYVCGFDVGLMPYQASEHTQYIDPLKLYDYLAAGLPIASVDLPALDGFRHLVHVGNSPPEFIAAAEAALLDVSPAAIHERRQVAAANSWEQRLETLAALIQARLSERVPAPAGGRASQARETATDPKPSGGL